MKFVYALALLIASVTVFGATAQTVGIENELEELDLLISLNQNDYALDGLVSRVRDGLQKLVERVKAKLADNKELLEQFRAKIEEVQEKIRDLVKQGGARLQQAVQQIREKLQALIKAVFDKLNNQESFYEAEQEEKTFLQRAVERLRQLVQRGLDRLKERLSKDHQAVFEQVRGKIADIQKQILDIVKDDLGKAVQTIADARLRLRELLNDALSRIGAVIRGNQYAVEGILDEQDLADFYEGESILQLIAQRLRELAEKALAALKERIEQAKEVTEEVKQILKEKIGSLQEQVQQLREATTQQAIRIYQNIRKAVREVLEQLKNKISGESSLYESIAEEKPNSLLQRIITRVRDLAQRVLNKIKERLAPHKETLEKLKTKIAEVQAKIVELGKAVGAKAQEVIKSLRLRLRELVQQVKDSLKESSSYAAEDDDEEVDEGNPSLIKRLVDRIRSIVQRSVDKLQETLASQKEVFAEFKDKIDEVNAGLLELGKKSGKKALEAVRNLREKVRELNKAVFERLTGKGAFYELVEDEEEDDTKNPLLTRIAQRVRAITERALKFIKAKLAESKELAAEFKEKVDEVTAQLAVVAKQTGKKALEAARELREKVSALRKAVVNRIKEVITGSLYEAEEEQDQSIKDLVGQAVRAIIEKISAKVKDLVEQAKVKIGEGKEVLGDLKVRASELADKLKELSKQSLRQALQSLAQIREKVYELLREIKQRISEKVGGLYEAEQEEEQSLKELLQQKIRELVEKVRAKIQELIEKAKEKIGQGKEVFADLKERVDKLAGELKDLSKKTFRQALQSVAQIREKIYEILREIRTRISGQSSFYEAEVETEEPVEESRIQKVIQRVRALVQRALERVKDLLSKRKDILEKVKGKVAEVTQKLAELAKEHGQKAIAAAKALRQKIRDLIKDIAGRIAEEKPASYSSNYDLRDTVTKIRDLVLADGGIQALRLYLDNLKSTHPTVALVRTYIQSSSDDALLEILEEFFSGLSYSQQAPTSDLANLFRQLRTEVLNEEGIQRLRAYAKTIETVHPIVQRIKIALETRPTDAIIAFLSELFSGLDVYAAPENIQSLVQQVKEQLLLDEGLQRLRTYAGTILPRHPVAILIKLHVIESSDAELRELINELIQVDYYDGGFYEDLKTSMKTIKDFILSQEGIEALKGYFGNLETSHPVVLRLKSLVEQASNDVILQVATEILGNI